MKEIEISMEGKTELRKVCNECVTLHDKELFQSCDDKKCNCPCNDWWATEVEQKEDDD